MGREGIFALSGLGFFLPSHRCVCCVGWGGGDCFPLFDFLFIEPKGMHQSWWTSSLSVHDTLL